MCSCEVHGAGDSLSEVGPVIGVAQITSRLPAAAQHAPHEAATDRQNRAAEDSGSSRAHTVTTASAIPIANHAAYRIGHSPVCEGRPSTNIRPVSSGVASAYPASPHSCRRARAATSAPPRDSRASSHAVGGSRRYQATSTDRLQACPISRGPSAEVYHSCGRYRWVSVSSLAHAPGSVRCSRYAAAITTITSAQYAGRIRTTRLAR